MSQGYLQYGIERPFTTENPPPEVLAFDLKGRKSRESENPSRDQVLLDQNFREWSKGHPLSLPHSQWLYFQTAIFNDTLFLSKLSIIDYSLLLLVVKSKSPDPALPKWRLVVGMIDYLRPYTWDKQVESVTKTVLNVAQREEDVKPTIIDPQDYRNRFAAAMNSFFCAVVAVD